MRKAPGHINKLTMAAQYKLIKYVEQEYVKSTQTDIAFAATASESLGFVVTVANVAGCREALDIKSNRVAQCEERKKPHTVLARLAALESAMLSLQQRMDVWEK